MKDLDKLVDMFERPTRTAAITGLPVTVSMTTDAARAVAALLRLLGEEAAKPTSPDAQRIIRLTLENVGLFSLIKLWLLVRIGRLAGSISAKKPWRPMKTAPRDGTHFMGRAVSDWGKYGAPQTERIMEMWFEPWPPMRGCEMVWKASTGMMLSEQAVRGWIPLAEKK